MSRLPAPRSGWRGWRRRAILLPLAQRALRTLINASDRTNAGEEAELSALEAALWLMRVNRGKPGQSDADREELLRSALGCARALVVTTGYALVQTTDTRRAQFDAGQHSALDHPNGNGDRARVNHHSDAPVNHQRRAV